MLVAYSIYIISYVKGCIIHLFNMNSRLVTDFRPGRYTNVTSRRGGGRDGVTLGDFVTEGGGQNWPKKSYYVIVERPKGIIYNNNLFQQLSIGVACRWDSKANYFIAIPFKVSVHIKYKIDRQMLLFYYEMQGGKLQFLP